MISLNRNKIAYLVLLLIVLSIFQPLELKCQDSLVSKQPKIGLVLSGGGAKGFAHIGVLKVLEEAGIRPDYITGTSMGAIIGGLYALGYSADELSALNATTDWNTLFTDDLPLNKIIMEEKYESKRYVFKFPIINFRLKVPPGFVEGQKLEMFLRKLAWSNPVNEFDSLDIPFHCMSTDLRSGLPFEHKSGDLIEAMRASMSIPRFFIPVAKDSSILVDGGVVCNYPVSEVRRMGADIVIGVYVSYKDNVGEEELSSMSDVLFRTTSLGGIVDSRNQMKDVDIQIIPDLEDFDGADFFRSKEIEKIGEDAARSIIDTLRMLAVSKPEDRITKHEKPIRIIIDSIEVENVKTLTDNFVIGLAGLEIGSMVGFYDINAAIENLYGTNYFDKVTYYLKKSKNGNYILVFKVKERVIRFLNLAPYYDNIHDFGIVANFTIRSYLLSASRMMFTGDISDNPAASFDINKYFGVKQRFMYSAYALWKRNTMNYYFRGSEFGNYTHTIFYSGLGLKFSMGLNRQFEASSIVELTKFDFQENAGSIFQLAELRNYKSQNYGFRTSYEVKTIDDYYFPKRGYNLLLQYKYFFAAKEQYHVGDVGVLTERGVKLDQNAFHELYAGAAAYKTFFKRATVGIGSSLAIHSDVNGLGSYYRLGGINTYANRYIPFAGLNYGELLVDNLFTAHSELKVKLFYDIYFSMMGSFAYYTNNLEDMYVFSNDFFQDRIFGYCFGFMYNSPLGPMQLLLGGTDLDKNVRLYLHIGYFF